MKHQATKSPSDQLLAVEWNAEHLVTEGLDASKPMSGLVARQLYWATDTKILYKATSATAWEELLRGETVSRLAQLSEKSHANLTNVTASQHHTKTVGGDINLADLAEKAHSSLTGVTSDQHHAEDHASRHVDGGADEITSKLDFRATNVITEKSTRTSPFTTTSTSFVDMGLSVDITIPYTANVLVFAQWCYVRNYTAGKSTYEALYRDTTNLKQLLFYANYADYRLNSLLTYMDVNLAADTYTYKMRAKVSGGTGYWCGGTDELTAYIVAQATKS
ncbi:hypothetical protein KAU93_05365 [Candidatus Bathyarchaeota archaeon]|nr:hypothetical protein [Candidatus Bathyarchaeota archaeon]